MNKIWSGLGLAVLGIALLVGAAGAEVTGNTIITANNPATTSISVTPESFSWTFTPGVTNTYETAATTFTASTNSVYGAKVEAKESASGTSNVNQADGFMYSEVLSDKLDAALQIASGEGTITGSPVTLGADNGLIWGSSSAGSTSVDFNYQQAVGWADAAASEYKITVTFTVTPKTS